MSDSKLLLKEAALAASSRLWDLGNKATKLYIIAIIGGPPIGLYLGIFKAEALTLNELADILAGA